MKKHLFVLSASLLLIMILSSCSDPKIYTGGKEWKFSMKSSAQDKTDTVYFKSFDESIDFFDIKSHWVRYTRLASGGSTLTVGESGIVDGTMSGLTKHKINIYPIRSSDDYSKLTGMLPYPSVEYSISIGNKIDWERTPGEGWKELKGKTVKGYIEVVERIYYSDDVIQDSCWVLLAKGNSEVGDFSAKYYFSDKYGFIYFNYDFIEYTLEIKLIDYNDNADSSSILPAVYFDDNTIKE